MSEKRYEVRIDKRDCEYIHDNQTQENFVLDRACDLLNTQAETIEVLREENENLKRRIAALDGK